jgi:hypothetical protein
VLPAAFLGLEHAHRVRSGPVSGNPLGETDKFWVCEISLRKTE